MERVRFWGLLAGLFCLGPSALSADDGHGWLGTIAKQALPSASAQDDKPATVAGTRGLNEPGDTVDTTARDDAAIDRLDKITITPSDLDRFIKEGHLL